VPVSGSHRTRQTPKFGERYIKRMIGFPRGLDTLHSPFMVKEDVLTVLENGEVDTEGTVRKRRGFRSLYDAPFASSPVRGLYNYVRSDDQTARLVAVAGGRVFYDFPHIVRRFDTQRDFNEGTHVHGTTTADEVPGDLRLTTLTVGFMHGGSFIQAATGSSVAEALAYRGRCTAFDQFGRFWIAYLASSTSIKVIRSTDNTLTAFEDMNFPTPSGYKAHSLGSMATDSQGRVHFVWFAQRSDDLRVILYSRYDPNQLQWKSPIYVAPDLVERGKDQYRPHILVDEREEAPMALYVIWHGYGDRDQDQDKKNVMSVKIARSFDGGDTWTPWQVVGAGTYYKTTYDYSRIYPTATIAAGVLHVIYQGQVSNSRYYLLHAFSVDQGATWVDAEPVIRYDGHQPRFPSVASDNNGNLYLVWAGTDPGSPNRSRIKLREYSTHWHQVVYLTDTSSDCDLPVVATNEIEQVFVVYEKTLNNATVARMKWFNPRINRWSGEEAPFGESATTHRPTMPEKAFGRIVPIAVVDPEGGSYRILVQKMNPPLFGAWESPPINISQATSREGTITATYTTPGNGSVRFFWASSADNNTYSSWTETTPGTPFTVPSDHPYIKVRVELRRSHPSDDAILDWVQITFVGSGGMQQLASGLADRPAHFAVFNDILYMVNGQDAMKYWDPYATDRPTFGDAGGAPPTGDAIVAHKERLFVARGHRLYFSEAFDAEKWPALNFIDIGVGSEGRITALRVLYDALYIFKERAIYVLQGSTPEDFEVKRVSDRVGTLAPYSVTNVDDTTMGFWGPRGYLFFDGVELSTLSDPVTQIVEGLVKHLTPALAPQIAAGALDGRVYISIPDEHAQVNSMTLVFDQDTKSWTVYRGMAGSVFIVAKRGDRYELVWGSPTEGQLYTLSDDFTDNGTAYTMAAETAQTFLDHPERMKRPRSVFILASSPDRDTTLNVYLRTEDGQLRGPVTVAVRGGGELQTIRILPSVIGVYMVRSLAIRVEHTEPVEVAFHGAMIEFVPKSVR